MNPPEILFQAQADHRLRALPSLPPKKRSRAAAAQPDEKDAASVIVPFYDPLPKPAKFPRSGQPFQVWKDPTVHEHGSAPQKADLRATISESVQGYARSMAFLLSWRLDHSP
jgi:hypothetical protein